jgi:predicted amidohydrolase YtcJ
MVITNGKIVTLCDRSSEVEAAAIKDGKILVLGTSRKISRFIGPSTYVLDVKGALVLPGFIDAHTHFVSGGRSLKRLNFRGVNSVEKIQEMVAAKIKESPPGSPIHGIQFDHTLFQGEKWPSKDDLDKVSPNNPVVIARVDMHASWVNSLALRQSNIGKNTKDPFGGEIVRNPKTGEPTGILKETAANLVNLPGDKPAFSAQEDQGDIERGLLHAAKLGLTGVHTSSTLEEIEIYRKLNREGKLSLRVYAWLPIQEMDKFIEKGIKQGQGDDMVKIGHLKAYIDGTLGSGTALMFEPFSDAPDKVGLPQYKEEEFYELVEKAHKNGFQLAIHAIGDKGVNWVLNAFERAQKKYGVMGLRHRMEHAQIMRPGDIKRFRELGVIASMQPTHCTTDMRFCETRIGEERSKGAYVWKSLLESGARLAFGTDWDVEPLDPMRGLYSAVTRKNIESDLPEGGWFSGQKLTMAEAIRCYTLGSAYAAYEENIKGSLEAGKMADMVVLSKDLFSIDPKDILTTEVLFTILGGRIVYQKE